MAYSSFMALYGLLGPYSPLEPFRASWSLMEPYGSQDPGVSNWKPKAKAVTMSKSPRKTAVSLPLFLQISLSGVPQFCHMTDVGSECSWESCTL